jgi:transposase
MPYSSSLTDEEWKLIEPLLPRRSKQNYRVGQSEYPNFKIKTKTLVDLFTA